jgi:hypothetical protein
LHVQAKPEKADAFIIAVPTPFKGEKLADMSFGYIGVLMPLFPVFEKAIWLFSNPHRHH